jgi:hypothetical protein
MDSLHRADETVIGHQRLELVTDAFAADRSDASASRAARRQIAITGASVTIRPLPLCCRLSENLIYTANFVSPD